MEWVSQLLQKDWHFVSPYPARYKDCVVILLGREGQKGKSRDFYLQVY
jgi:hypothetical protein